MINKTETAETLILEGVTIPLLITTKRKLHLSFRFIDGILFVSAPLNASITEIKKALTQKSTWILKHHALSKARSLKDNEIRLHDHRLRVAYQRGKTFSYSITETDLVLTHSDRMLPQTALKRFKKDYSDRCLSLIFEEAVRETGLRPSALLIKETRASHGRCNSKKQITLSSRLIEQSLPYIRYVCIHELAHLRHMNHSSAFYALVKVYCPDYKKLVAHTRSASL